MEKIFLASFVLVFLVGYSTQHSYNLGECPNVAPMSDFDMNRLLGEWYVVKKTSTSSSCLSYNFTRTDEPDTYQIEQTSHTFVPGNHAYHYTGQLTVPDTAVPARMKVKFPLNFGSASYTVFMTDYDNYAGIFTCQKVAFSNRQSVSILSRRRSLDNMYMEKIQNKLKSYNVNPYDLSIISQKDCSQIEEGYNVNIDSNTFSAKSIAGVVRKAGEKLGDGVEYIAGGAKKIYHKYTDDDDKKEQVENVRSRSNYDINPDSEWLP